MHISIMEALAGADAIAKAATGIILNDPAVATEGMQGVVKGLGEMAKVKEIDQPFLDSIQPHVEAIMGAILKKAHPYSGLELPQAAHPAA